MPHTFKVFGCYFLHIYEMSYDIDKLYYNAYSIKYNWSKWLHSEVYKYHELFGLKYNPSICLQMGVLLPFISLCLGLQTSGLWSTDPGVPNLFWINIAASGSGKSIARNKLIAETLDYMRDTNFDITFPDFKVSRFTMAGINSTNISIIYVPHMYSSYIFQICIHFMYLRYIFKMYM